MRSDGKGADVLARLKQMVNDELPSLVAIYKRLHAAPELSGQEEKTSALVARELTALGCTVAEGVGKYQRHDWPGYGVVGVLENGAGPTVLVRADMDALPIEEKTGLPYASKVKGIYRDGSVVPVMHACGHDLHVASLVGTARVLAQLKDCWRGTVVLIGQPGEEGGGGADAMLADDVFRLFPQPDYALALHATLQREAGSIGYVAGNFMSSFTDVEVVLRGVGSHGSAPELGKDPIVMAANFVLALQSIVSREKSPFQAAVVTVGSIHGGAASNVIPDEVRMQLSVRAYDDKVRDRMIASIERIAKGVALTAGVPENRRPIVTLQASHPVNYNDPDLTDRVAQAATRVLGAEKVVRTVPVMVSEDFGSWSLNGAIRSCMFWLGAADPEQYRASQQQGIALPSHHSPLFAPLPEPSIATGVTTMAAAVLDLLAP
jgi:amidohydrolase